MSRKGFSISNGLLLLIWLLLIFQKVNCDEKQLVKLVCSKVELSGDFPRVISTSFSTESSKSTLDVVEDSSGTIFNTSIVKWMRIENQDKPVKFMPARINKFFPIISAFVIVESGLTHLEQNDMRQFGDMLKFSNFRKNLLTSLEGDVFEINTNLKYIILSGNPLKHISPKLFKSFENMSHLKKVVMGDSDCINQTVKTPFKAEEWKGEKCTDKTLMEKNLNRINERAVFFCDGKNCIQKLLASEEVRGNWSASFF